MPSLRLAHAVLLAALETGCISVNGFNCERDADCDLEGRAGFCEEARICSYEDSACDSNRRYTENGGPLAGECVELVAGTTTGGPEPMTTTTQTPTTGVAPEVCDGVDNDTDGLIDEFGPQNQACDGCTLFATADRSWAACSTGQTWSNATIACTDRGMTLASIHSAAEQAAVDAVVPFPDAFWIGLNDRDVENIFGWSDGTPFDYMEAWAEGQPSDADNEEDCVATRTTEGWSDRSCGLPLGYVCAR